MFLWMRNTHLILGLVFLVMVVVFAVSSLTIIYRPWLPTSKEDYERTVAIAAEDAATPRALALELMRNHGLEGDLLQIRQTDDEIRFRIARPGTQVQVQYSQASGEAKLETRRFGFLETLVQLHVNHGFHHEFLPAWAWGLLSLLSSIGLLLLGATGIYLWFALHEARVSGTVLLVVGLVYGLTTLVWSRMG